MKIVINVFLLTIQTALWCQAGISAELRSKTSACETIPENAIEMDFTISRDLSFLSKELCYFRQSKTENSLELCKKISNADLNGRCISALAIMRNDYKLCKQIHSNKKDPLLSTIQLNECLRRYARDKSDPEACKLIKYGNSIEPTCLAYARAKMTQHTEGAGSKSAPNR